MYKAIPFCCIATASYIYNLGREFGVSGIYSICIKIYVHVVVKLIIETFVTFLAMCNIYNYEVGFFNVHATFPEF